MSLSVCKRLILIDKINIMTSQKHIVIVGGGFGGVKLALDLSKSGAYRITLVSDRDDFWYFPTLYHAATGAPTDSASIPLTDLFNIYRVNLVKASATKLSRDKRYVHLSSGKKIHYDYVVFAMGVVTNYFGIKGLDQYSYGIKSIDEADRLKQHIHTQLMDEQKPDLNYVVVGGGPTGIELAAQLPAYVRHIMKKHGMPDKKVRVELIEGAKQLLPRMQKKVGRRVARQLKRLGVHVRLGQAVQGETADALMINGKSLRSHTVVWTAGQANNPFFDVNGFTLSGRHKVVVNEYLEAEPRVFVIGDNAETEFSGMAQTALYDAEYLAANFLRVADGDLRQPYKSKKPIYVIPVGDHWAAVEWGNVHLFGWIGWWLRELGDLKGFLDIEKPVQAGEQWMKEFQHDRQCPTCS